MASVVHVYQCRHAEREHVADGEQVAPEFVFVEGPCPKEACVKTDPTWFQQGAKPTPDEKTFFQHLGHLLTSAKADALKELELANALAPLTSADIADSAASPEVRLMLELAEFQEYDKELDEWLSIPAVNALVRFGRGFTKSGKQRPFFDFCMQGVLYNVKQASVRVQELHDTVTELMKHRKVTDGLHVEPFAWMEYARNYQPSLGQEDLALLRISAEGLQLLDQPLSEHSIRQARMLINANRKLLGLPAIDYDQADIRPIDTGFRDWLQEEGLALGTALRTQRKSKAPLPRKSVDPLAPKAGGGVTKRR